MAFRLTTNPSQAWPIIDREKIDHFYDDVLDIWHSRKWIFLDYDIKTFEGSGKTSLEAAMRCHVASVYGNEVEL
jgi:hypothetical protein